MWEPTGKIRYRKAIWFGRRKLVLQLQESRFNELGQEDYTTKYGLQYRWRDATPADLPVKGFGYE